MLARLPARGVRHLPGGDLCCELAVVLRERSQLPQHIVLRATARSRENRRRRELLAGWIDTSLHLQDAVNESLLVSLERDEHDHSAGQCPTKGQEVGSHGSKNGPVCRLAQTVRPSASPTAHFPPETTLKKKVLVIDIGGSHVKALVTGHRVPARLPSGPKLTPQQMVDRVLDATKGWHYDAVTIGYPGPIVKGKIAREPHNLGRGWKRFDFQRAFGKPVRLVNDAAMQALGSYAGRRMLFLGLGTGLGTTLVHDGVVIPLELAHLPYRNGKTYEQYLGQAGLHRLGRKKWRAAVADVVGLLLRALVADYAVLGGGNARLLTTLPPNTRRGRNTNAFRGGFRLWQNDASTS